VDTRFGNGGRTRIASRQPVAVLVQPGGKIVVAGNDSSPTPGYRSSSLTRYRSDGSPDNSLGSTSIVRLEDFYVEAAALEPDLSIVLAGGGPEAQVARLMPDGQLDRQFGGDGVVGEDGAYGAFAVVLTAVAVLPHGAVAIAGMTTLGSAYRSSGWLSAVAQPDGSWEDLSWPPGSCLAEDNPDYPKDVYMVATAIAVAKDGKVLIAGHSDCDSVIGRFTSAPDSDPGPPLRLDT
jgi:uncharacterized delta-60 repeat protein